MRHSHIAVIGAPLDLGQGRRGVDMGPSALRVANLNARVAALGYEVEDLGNIAVEQAESCAEGNAQAKYLAQIAAACELLGKQVIEALDRGRLPLVLGGDHSVAVGTVSGVAQHFRSQGRTIGMIWLDAHADMNTPGASPSGNVHGMPLAAILGRGAPELVRAPGTYPSHLSFSRDGHRMTYVNQITTGRIEEVRFDPDREALVGEPKEVLSSAKGASRPAISPDGEWLAYNSTEQEEHLYVARADGSSVRQLTTGNPRNRGPRWSPDGKRIALFSRRSGDWVKIKCHRDAEFVIVGLTRGEGARSNLGAIDVASFHGKELKVRGKVGSGLDQSAIATLLEMTHGQERKTCAASGSLEPAPKGRTFLVPSIVVSVRFAGWTEDGRLRHPVFQGIREDIEPEACTSTPPNELMDDSNAQLEPQPTLPHAEAPRVSIGRNDKNKSNITAVRQVKISNPRKVYWPEDGITKGHLIEYYEQIAEVMLPCLQDRPVILVRYPDGIAGKHFYQWNVPHGIPSWVPTLELPPENGQGQARQGFLINDVETLKYVVNLGCIPIHMLASRSLRLDTCDFITLDLDVAALNLLEAIAIAHSLREIIEGVGLEAFAKTSGQTGLHLLVPLGPGVPYEAARLLVELLGRLATLRHTSTATMERRRDKRGPRVYVPVVSQDRSG